MTAGSLAPTMKIARQLYDEIVAHAREEAPNECCGMVGSSDGHALAVYRATNAEASPLRFRIDPDEQLELHTKIEDAGLDHGRDLPLAHPDRAEAVADRHQFREAVAGRPVDHRRPGRRRGRGQDVAQSRTVRCRTPNWSWSDVPQAGARSCRARLPRLRHVLSRADERFCATCKLPLVYGGEHSSEIGAVSESHERARKIKPQLTEGRLVKVAWARNQAEAEFIQGMLLEEGVPSMLRRSAGFDVPDFLAAGPRDVLVPETARDDRARGAARRAS